MAPKKRRQLVGVKVKDVQKRRYPSKHYVYIIEVTWDDRSNTVIYRRYSKFFDFQIALLEFFPKEGGLRDPSERVIPFLPGKILFRRSHVKEVALKRLGPIDEYCNALVQLPPHISNSEHVLDFFESKPEDLNPNTEDSSRRKKKDDQDISEISAPILLDQYRVIADFTKTQTKELTVAVGQQVEVIEKHENGWWFVSDEEGERGWVPGVYLQTRDGQTENLVTKQAELGQGEKYITTAQFTAGSDDEITFGSGVLVEVLQKNLEGWWWISYQGKQGWAPASYLEKPAEAVLRQNTNRHLSPVLKSTLEHRRSFPGDGIDVSLPDRSPSPVNAQSSIKLRNNHLKLTKTNSNPSMVPTSDLKNTISDPIPNQPRPPPKRLSLKRSSVAPKPQNPPPLPPAPKPTSEPLYDYVTTASFSGDIPHGINFKQDQTVKVLEKSPGDWWFIELDGEEGWAPASHVKRVFRSENRTKISESPKPFTTTSKPTFTKKPAASNEEVVLQNGSAVTPRQQLREAPVPPFKKSATSAFTKPNQPIIPPAPKLTSKAVSEPTISVANNNFRNVLKPVATNAKKSQINPPVPPAKPGVKPVPISNKPKLKSNPAGKKNFLNGGKPTSPPGNFSSKPSVPEKKFPNDVATTEKTTNQHDFRSVLKSASNNGKRSDIHDKPRPAVPGKPTLPVKPLNKNTNNKASPIANGKKPTKTKTDTSGPSKPPTSTKPVLRRFQNLNSNNNNDQVKKFSKPEIVVNRVEIEQSNPIFYKRRGSPDGQDDVSVSEYDFQSKSTTADGDNRSKIVENSNLQLYKAIFDSTTVDFSEVSFSVGDAARLIETAENDWWYVEINNSSSGWAPSFCFALNSNQDEKLTKIIETSSLLNNNLALPSCPETPPDDDSVYSEIGDVTDYVDNQLRRVVRSYSSHEESTVSVETGDLVQILDHSGTGWMYVQVTESRTDSINREGWLPSDTLQPVRS